MNWGSILDKPAAGWCSTAGANDRMFRRFDARSRRTAVVVEDQLRHHGAALLLEVDGTQYIAVQSGWGVDPAFQQGLMNDLLGTDLVVPQGGVVWVFALGRSSLASGRWALARRPQSRNRGREAVRWVSRRRRRGSPPVL